MNEVPEFEKWEDMEKYIDLCISHYHECDIDACLTLLKQIVQGIQYQLKDIHYRIDRTMDVAAGPR